MFHQTYRSCSVLEWEGLFMEKKWGYENEKYETDYGRGIAHRNLPRDASRYTILTDPDSRDFLNVCITDSLCRL